MKEKIRSIVVFLVVVVLAALIVRWDHAGPMGTVARQWRAMESCTGIERSRAALVDTVKVYAAPVIDPLISAGYDYSRRTISLPNYYRDSLWIVDHEIVHALLMPTVGGHPARFFNGLCGDLMHGRKTDR